MIQEEKQLLFKDLCGRLPYGTEISLTDGTSGMITSINSLPHGTFVTVYFNRDNVEDVSLEDIKPYLRPISSMTESEIDKLFDILHIDKDGNEDDWIKINDVVGIKFFFSTGKWVEDVAEAYDYLNSIHIDYRGLIKKGLALEAKEGMYK